MKKIIISCGGTGGHLAPGIALAEKVQERGDVCRLLISRKSIDAKLIGKYRDLDFVRCPGSPLSLRPIGLLRFLSQQMSSLRFSFRLIREFRPAMVVGFGGFQSAGMIVAAWLRGVPIVLHESNHVPGRATRLLQGLAKRVYLPRGVALRRTNRDRIRFCGAPVRNEIMKKPKEESRRALGLKPEGKWLMVLGGSQGAASLNIWVREHGPALAKRGVNLYCVTGPDKGKEEILRFPSDGNGEMETHLVAFSDRISEVLSAADLVVSRAGAGTISELVRCRAPSVLIPYPYAADNHQWENARFLEREGGAIVVDEKNMPVLEKRVLELLFDDAQMSRVQNQLEAMDREDAGQLIRDDIEGLCAMEADAGRIPFLTKVFRGPG